jgi:uncharacterized protein YecE (DUF72 family)
MDLFGPPDIRCINMRLGTSGFSFPDWSGVFYPGGLSRKGWLAFYATRFNALELNASYYRILPPSATAGMADSVPPGFVFCVKLNSGMTHERNAGDAQWKAFDEMLAPLRSAGCLGPVLAQFPWSLPLSEHSFQTLSHIRERLGDLPAVAEFRHERWYSREALQRVVETGFSPVAVDLPDLPGLPGPELSVKGSIAYARLHGRNSVKWWGGGALRYDYAYTPAELLEWGKRARAMARGARGAYVFFNNCHMGRAALDARTMGRILEELQ